MEEMENELDYFDEEMDVQSVEMSPTFENEPEDRKEQGDVKKKSKKTKKVNTRRLIEEIEEANRLRKELEYLES